MGFDIDTVSLTIPHELHASFVTAARAYENLEARGAHLHFALRPDTGRVKVEVHDLAGRVQSSISVSDALRLAAGGAFP